MTPTTDIALSPFDCRWIVRGSEHHLGDWHYAVCLRVRNQDRVVNEYDCSRCLRWRAPDDADVRGDALWPGRCQ